MIDRVVSQALIDFCKRNGQIETVVWMNQRAPRPANTYIGLDIIAGPLKVGRDNIRYNGDNYFIAGRREYTLSVNVYGRNANEIAALIVDSIEKPSTIEFFSINGIGFVEVSDVRILDQLLETDVEGRAQFDFRFATSRNNVDDETGIITQVELTNDINPVSTVIIDDQEV